MRRDGEPRGVIPLHGGTARAQSSENRGANPGSWDAACIVHEAPGPLRPLIVDLLGAVGVDEEELDELRRHLPTRSISDCTPEEMGAAISIVRTAVERASVAGASPDVSRTRHACLDAASVAWAQDALDRRSRDQRHLLRDVSHDIRSPLNSILFLADALRTGHSGPLTSVQERQVDVLFMAAVTLVKLVNDLIDYAHLDDSVEIRVADATFSPAAVVEEVNGLLGPLLEYHDVELELVQAAAQPRRGDARLLNRVLLNLASNAIQAMPEGGRLRIELSGGPDDALGVSVEDDGPGVDVAEVNASLAAAVAGASLAETDGWTHGLGLSISARLVAAAGGQLSAEANQPRGTRFRLSLPFEAV